jgi:hypothetical protein
MAKSTQESLIPLRHESHKKTNKNRIDKPFKVKDIVLF